MTLLTDADQTRIAALVRETARAEIMPRFQHLAPDDITAKSGPQDLVTVVDLAAEKRLTEGLQALFPSALVVGEEAITADPSLRDALDEAELSFIIDPVDGTWNFANGLPLFGVILAAARRGRPFYGLLHDPVTDNWITAIRGGPARQVRADGRAEEVRVSAGGAAARTTGYMHFYMLPPAQRVALAPALPGLGRMHSLRCSCHEYRTLARGSADYCLSGALNPWDHAAGAVIVEAAGGHVAMLDGRGYDTHIRAGFLLSAANAATWQAIRDHVGPRLEGVA